MFDVNNNSTQCFYETKNIEDQILELRSIVTELEFKREEMCENMDRLQRALNSISLNSADTVNK